MNYSEESFDFAALLEQSFEDMDDVQRGDLLDGTILAVDDYGMIIDVGLKRDGVITRAEMDQIIDENDYEVGDHIMVMVADLEDREGNLVVSIQQARASHDWEEAHEQMERDEPYLGNVLDANKGGLIVLFGELRGFVPASHVADMPRGLDDDERERFLSKYVGKTMTLKIIEVNARRRRLVLSQREMYREKREAAKEKLLEKLNEGDIVTGHVRSLRDFGAFVDLGGADGLIHISELAWRRIRNPSEVLEVGQEVKVSVIQVDAEQKRIGLSLKRLQNNPWDDINQTHVIGQQVEGRISRVVSYGAFVELENGIEALLHISEMGDPAPEDPSVLYAAGDEVTAQIISLEPDRQRMGLSMKTPVSAEA